MFWSENFSRQLAKANASRNGRPNKIWAGERWQLESGVLRSCSMAFKKLSVFKDPEGPIFERKSLLAVLTATSARPFDCGKYAEDSRWLTPHWSKKRIVALALNSGPPSLASSVAIPCKTITKTTDKSFG